MNEQLSLRKVTTRKPPRCFGCATTFPTGSSMEIDTGVSSESGFYSDYWCLSCASARDKFFENSSDPCDSIEFGEIKYWEKDTEALIA